MTDILSEEYITAANAELAFKPCPVCGEFGTAMVAKKFLPSASFSLAGRQDKLSGRFELVLSCSACGIEARLSKSD